MTKSLDIFVENRRRFSKTRAYKLNYMLRGFSRAGFEWRVIDNPGAARAGRADAAFFHLDLSDLPTKFVEAANDYSAPVNGKVKSIRKSIYSSGSLARDSGYDGPVIVKTDLNFRGIPEKRYAWRKTPWGIARHAANWLIDRNYIEKSCPLYSIHDSIADVPDEVWSDEKVFVEKFYPGVVKPPIVKHRVEFFFDVKLVTRSTFDDVMCDVDKIISIEIEDEIPEEIQALRKRLGLDYGAIDYFVDERDGSVEIIDANKTVSLTDSWVAQFPFVAKHAVEVTDCLIEYVRAA